MSFFAWIITLLGLVFMYPWARWLLARHPGGALLTGLTTLALSAGTLSLIMLWLGLFGIRLDWRLAALLCLFVALAGWIVWWRSAVVPAPTTPAPPDFLSCVIAGILVIIAGLILFNALYWPFSIDDSVAIYAWYGKQIALSGQLPRGDLYETYPMAIPLLYAFTHQAAGWIDEYLARLIPALFAVGVPGAAYLLGSALHDRQTGLIAALLIALAPLYSHWASTGYVDLPTGFFFGLTAFFLVRWSTGYRWRDALLTGFMAGMAAWIKNSGLLIVISLGAWLIYRALVDQLNRKTILRQGALIAFGFLIVAGPWYLRNLSLAGFLVPPTGWTSQAQRTLANLFYYLTETRYWIGRPIFTLGIGLALWQAFRAYRRESAAVLLTVFFLPFFVIWWALFSYDGRFLFALTSIVAVMGARLIAPLARRAFAIKRARARLAVTLALAALALPAAVYAVDFKNELLRHPFMSDAEKHRVVLGDRYAMALYLQTLPKESRVLSGDNLLPYHADGVQVMVGGAPSAAALKPYNYWVLNPGQSLPDWYGPAEPLHAEGGFRLYQVKQ
jgi:hypothetical protein